MVWEPEARDAGITIASRDCQLREYHWQLRRSARVIPSSGDISENVTHTATTQPTKGRNPCLGRWLERVGLFWPGPASWRAGEGHYSNIDDLKVKDGTVITTKDEWWSKRRPEIFEAMQEELHGRIPDASLWPNVKRPLAGALSEAVPARRNGDHPNHRHSSTRRPRGCANRQAITAKCGLPMWVRQLLCLSKSNTGTRTRLPGHNTPHRRPAASSRDPWIMPCVVVPLLPIPCLVSQSHPACIPLTSARTSSPMRSWIVVPA